MGSTNAMTGLHESNGWGPGQQYLRPQNIWLGSRKPTARSQEADDGGLGNQRLGCKKYNCCIKEINGWGAGARAASQGIKGPGPGNPGLRPGNQWLLGHRSSMAVGQGSNGWSTGNQWLGPRKQVAEAHATNGWGRGNQWLGSWE